MSCKGLEFILNSISDTFITNDSGYFRLLTFDLSHLTLTYNS